MKGRLIGAWHRFRKPAAVREYECPSEFSCTSNPLAMMYAVMCVACGSVVGALILYAFGTPIPIAWTFRMTLTMTWLAFISLADTAIGAKLLLAHRRCR